MAFRIYLDQTIIRIVDEDGNNAPIYYPAGQTKYYVDKGKFYFFDGVGGQNFNNHAFEDFRDQNGSPFASEDEFIAYLNGFINITVTGGFVNNPISPLMVTQDEITVDDIDWEASDFTGWSGVPEDLFGNVNNGGIYNDSADNPKTFTLRLKRTKKMRDFGVGASTGNFSNIKATILGSGDQERGFLDASQDPSKETSFVYSEEEFVFNAIKVEFFTADRVDVTNIFLKYTSSDRKQQYVHKFGLNPDIDSGGNETIWTLGDTYIFTTTPTDYYISSSSASDTLEIKGELIVVNTEGRYARHIYEIILQGQTPVKIPTPNDWLVVASNRAFNNNGVPLTGTVYIYEDTTVTEGVPNDLSTVRSVVSQGVEQTEQAVYTVPEFLEDGRKVIFAELYRWEGSAIRGRDTVGIFDLFVAERGKVPKVKGTRGLSTYYVSGQDFGENTPLIIEPGSDIYIQASEIDVNNTTVEANFTLKLVIL